jgi:glutamine synthetase
LDREDVLRAADEAHVRFVQLQFTDILGSTKSVAIPRNQLERALAGEIVFDGGAIEGFVRLEESDMHLLPDPDTFAVFPWEEPVGRTARLICDIVTPDGEPSPGCARTALRRVLARAEGQGYRFLVAAEPEFFLFPRRGDQVVLPAPDRAGYFDQGPLDPGETARRDMVLALTAMGFQVEASHHEGAPGQHEIDFGAAGALTTADNISTFRFVVRTIALRHGLHATFMPKPVYGQNGSGLHLLFALEADGRDGFTGEDGGLSAEARHFVAGILAHIDAVTAVANPLVNSYKRLVAGYEAPVYAYWSEAHPSPLIRATRSGGGWRLELRSPDPSCNPYLALAAILAAGLDGLDKRLPAPPPLRRNPSRLTEAERRELGIAPLPATLAEALDALRADHVVQEALGEFLWRHFLEAKGIEWRVYETQVHAWEREQYLETF